jgi:hypothetical protein
LRIPVVPFVIDDPQRLRDLAEFRELALSQLRDCIPQEAAALFDVAGKIPGAFKRHGLKAVSAITDGLKQRQVSHTKSQLAISRKDCIAPYLDEDLGQLSLYEEFVGKGRVLSELQYAICHGLIVGDAGLKYANPYINHRPQDWIVGTTPSLYPLNAPLMLPPTQPQPTIGNQRLTAVDVPVVPPVARAVEEPVLLPEPDEGFDWQPEPVAARYSPPVEPANVVAPKRPKQPNFIDRVVASPTISRINFGGQRSGKTLSFAAASKILADAGWSIYHINLASYTNERGINEDDQYWLHATSVRADLSKLSPWEAAPIIERAEEVVTEFFSNPKSILIIDEIVTTGGKDHEHAASCEKLMASIADKISCLTSTGTKRMQAIWALSPDFVAGRLMDQVKSVKSLKVCMVVVPPDRFIAWEDGAGESVRIGFSSEAFTNVQRNFPSLTEPPRGTGCDRIAFIDGEWMEVGDVSFMFNQSKKSAKSTKATKPPCATENQLQTLAEAGDVPTLESLKKALDERVAMTAQERAAMAELKGRK